MPPTKKEKYIFKARPGLPKEQGLALHTVVEGEGTRALNDRGLRDDEIEKQRLAVPFRSFGFWRREGEHPWPFRPLKKLQIFSGIVKIARTSIHTIVESDICYT